MPSASCPSCGAQVQFKAATSIFAVCEYCRSALIRHDLDVENVGKMAELKTDGSPLQLAAEGRYGGKRFVVVGRIQLQYDRGVWNEWHLLFDDGRSGWLGEAQGTYVVTFLKETTRELPKFEALQIGQRVELTNQFFEVVNTESSKCIAGEGELPFKVGAGYEAPVADLQGDKTSFATLDYSDDSDKPLVFIGEY